MRDRSPSSSQIRRRVPSPKRNQNHSLYQDTDNNRDINSYFDVKNIVKPQKRRTVLREETFGINVGHLRRLARLAGKIPLGELAFNTLCCSICNKGDNDDSIIICDKCNKGFHLYCLKPILPSVPSGDWFCDNCKDNDKKKYSRNRHRLESSQSLIVDFFKLDKPIIVQSKYPLRNRSTIGMKNLIISQEETPRIITAMPSPAGKGRGTLRCYKPSTDVMKLKNQQVALAAAMFQQNIQFSYELVYCDGCSSKMNNIKFDEQRHMLCEMCSSDRVIYDTYIKLWKDGFMVPVLVCQDDIQGFVVIADEILKKDTLITEYIGEVDYLAKNEQNSNDSIMDLLRSGDPMTSLVIIPERIGNLARYLSGINNTTKEGRKKQNVRSARYIIDGQIHVLLIAKRDIKPGELLMYDYNGLENNYPTDHFV